MQNLGLVSKIVLQWAGFWWMRFFGNPGGALMGFDTLDKTTKKRIFAADHAVKQKDSGGAAGL